MKLTDERTELFQWDTGRTLTVDPVCTEVHFSDRHGKESFDVAVKDGLAAIPDELLQSGRELKAWCFIGTAECGYTKIERRFKVKRRNKPAGYVFTPAAQRTLDTVMERMEELENAMSTEAIRERIDLFLADNPLRAEECDPTVPAWAKELEKPAYTAAEVGAIDEASLEELRLDLKGEIQDEIAQRNQLRPEFANDITECIDSANVYLLPDGYLYGYMKKTVREDNNEYDPTYTNGLNKRINSSGSEVSYNGSYLTNYIEVEYAEEYNVTISGLTSLAESYSSAFVVDYFDASKTRLGYKTNANLGIDNATAAALPTTFNLFAVSGFESTKYVRIKLGIGDNSTVITAADLEGLVINFAPKNRVTTSTGWHNTGRAFVPTDYEDRIIDAEEQIEENTARLDLLEKAENGGVAIPDYWKTEADEAIAKVKALQDSAGRNAVSFVWFSDLHYGDNVAKTKHFGKVCAYVMDKLDIPFAVNCGDTLTSASLSTEGKVLSCLDGARELLSPIGEDRLLLVRGNHDDVYGSTSSAAYVNKLAPGKAWNRLHRFQSNDNRRVFGGDGTYFYVDLIDQKTRFVCLNSHFYEGAAVTNGTSQMMTNGFGDEQLAWLERALTEGLGDMDWHILIFAHVPPTYETINERSYGAQLSDCDDFQAVFGCEFGNIVGVFCGHCHVDTAVMGEMGYKVFTVTTAGGTPYGGISSNDRVAGTATEFAFDVVTVDKDNDQIYFTRVGFGEDREMSTLV